MMIASLVTALLLQTAEFTNHPETLAAYTAHACRVQQASNQGGEEADYAQFCDCLSANMAENSSEALFRALALGSQGALQDNAMVEDANAAREESERIFGELEPEEQLSSANVIQDGLYACMEFAPVRSE